MKEAARFWSVSVGTRFNQSLRDKAVFTKTLPREGADTCGCCGTPAQGIWNAINVGGTSVHFCPGETVYVILSPED